MNHQTVLKGYEYFEITFSFEYKNNEWNCTISRNLTTANIVIGNSINSTLKYADQILNAKSYFTGQIENIKIEPNIYSALTRFKTKKLAAEFFKLYLEQLLNMQNINNIKYDKFINMDNISICFGTMKDFSRFNIPFKKSGSKIITTIFIHSSCYLNHKENIDLIIAQQFKTLLKHLPVYELNQLFFRSFKTIMDETGKEYPAANISYQNITDFLKAYDKYLKNNKKQFNVIFKPQP